MKKGQAMLVAILIIFVAAIAIALAAATVAMGQTQGTVNQRLSSEAYNLAAAAIDNTLMRMTRNDFTNPGTLSEGTTSSTISISGSFPNYQVLAVAESTSPILGTKKVTRKIQADVTINNGVTTVTGYGEVY
ncbi:MAG: hypothetical protein Q7K11_00270 [Candidatus Berkelbacteria bacterium]|nr:hypothetical protein [Candidatus Berkelbacteria bacterium]